MRAIGWIVLGIAGLTGATWCLFAASMTAALGNGPTTPERLRTSAHWLMAGSAASTAIAFVALARLVRMHRGEGRPPGRRG